MTDKLAEEIIKQFVVEVEGLDGIEYVSHELAIYCMQAYHEAKMKEVTDEDIHRAAYSACMKPSMPNGEPEPEHTYYDAFIEGAKAMRDGEIRHVSRDNE